ncbi:MAG: hypothetical protein PUB63_00245 [Clostridia bacterium]|nr:hypothetical protein [Clostridia bacterium]
MKTRFALFCILLAAALICLPILQIRLQAEANDVAFIENPIQGDPAAALGASVTLRATMDSHLYWDVRHTFGGSTQTESWFTGQDPSRSSLQGPWFDLSVVTDVGASSTGNIDLEEECTQYMLRPALALAEETPAGETRTKTYHLADFYENYLIACDIMLPSRSNNIRRLFVSEEEQKIFSDWLRIPVLPQHQVKVTVTRDASGNVTDVESATVEDSGFYFNALSAYTEGGYYFTFGSHTTQGTVIDTSRLPDGYGIFVCPLTGSGLDVRSADPDHPIRLAVPLADDIEVLDLQTDPDETALFLLANTPDGRMLTVYDLPAMTVRQQYKVAESSDYDCDMLVQRGNILLSFYDQHLLLLTADADGRYQKTIEGSYDPILNSQYLYRWNVLEYAYGDGRLAIVYTDDYYNTCDFYLLIFDPTGLAYAARCGLDLNGPADQTLYPYDQRVRLDSLNPADDLPFLTVAVP